MVGVGVRGLDGVIGVGDLWDVNQEFNLLLKKNEKSGIGDGAIFEHTTFGFENRPSYPKG